MSKRETHLRLFTVTIQSQVVCLAKDGPEALTIAQNVHDREDDATRLTAEPLEYLPFGWNGKERPWTKDGESSLDMDALIEAGSAPVLTARMKAMETFATRSARSKRLSPKKLAKKSRAQRRTD